MKKAPEKVKAENWLEEQSAMIEQGYYLEEDNTKTLWWVKVE